MSLKPYKLEIRDAETEEVVSFGPRKMGATGRDILIVKKTLGAIVDTQSLIDARDDNPTLDDPDGWFDCMSGTTISNIEAATFDKNMQTYLIRFQLDNQFYILSYLFTKFTVNQDFERLQSVAKRPFAEDPDTETSINQMSSGGSISRIPGMPRPVIDDYLNSVYTSTQIDLITSMFESEFGTLGEATLAVLHGWIPRTRVGIKSYYHDPRLFAGQDGAYDLVLLGLYDSFTQGLLTQGIEDTRELIEPIDNFNDYSGVQRKGIEFLEKYKQQVSTRESIKFNEFGTIHPGENIIKSSYFGAIRYQIKTEEQKSPLYDAFTTISRTHPKTADLNSLTSEEYADALIRNFEPNPLVDPDPYIIDSRRMGFFNATEYTMENLPPRLREDATPEEVEEYYRAIAKLEDQALTRVLEHLGKPDAWFLDPQDARYLSVYGAVNDIFPNHSGYYSNQANFVLSTDTNIEKFRLLARAEKYSNLEDNRSGEPLIKFVEFRTPSLRPGDNYRAKFILNRYKLDVIDEGINIEFETEAEDLPQGSSPPHPAATESVIAASCDGEPVSARDQQRRYEEYRALASKRKREIARTIRERTLEDYNNNQPLENTSIDLGVFGNATLSLNTDSYEFTSQAFSGLSDLLTGTGTRLGGRNDISEVANPKFADITELTINFPDLESGLGEAAKNLESAQKNCNEDGIKIVPSNFNGTTEASRLKSIAAPLATLIKRENSNFEMGTNNVPGGIPRMNLSGFAGEGLSELKFRFSPSSDGKGFVVTSLKIGDKQLQNIDNLTRAVPALKNPRTVGYLAQVEEMGSGAGLFVPCEDLGYGKKGLAYIVKHTISLTGTSPEEFNPINKWAKNNIVDPIEKWRGLLKNQDFGLDAKFGTDEMLNVFGDQCLSLKDFFRQFADKHFLTGLLCDYLRCIKLPNFQFSLPNFVRPSLPDLSIFGWYISLVKSLIKNWEVILAQFLCAFAKALLDILSVPFCNEQLRDQLYGSGAHSSPTIKKALIDGLTDLSIRPENVEKSKQLIDEMALFLTGEELCRVLQGGAIDAPTMNMILRLAEKLGIEEVDTESTLREFFETISIFLPEGFCENLNQSTRIMGTEDCSETTGLLDQIRRRMLANDATDEEIDHAVDMAQKNLLDQATALGILGKEGLNGIIPTTLEFGNPDALVSALPPVLSEQINRSAKGLFEYAKMGYVSSLSSFGPSLFLQSNRLPKPGDPEFNEESSIIVQTILENLKLYAVMGNQRAATEERLTEQLHILHQIYELETYPDGNQTKVLKVFAQPEDQTIEVPQGDVQNYLYLDYEGRARTQRPLFLKPAGFLQSGFYRTDDSGNVVINGQSDPSPRLDMNRPLTDVNSLLRDFTFIGAYKILKNAEENDVVTREEGSMSFLREKINERLSELQAMLQIHLKSISTPIAEESYLKILRDVLSFSYENERERRQESELIEASSVSASGPNDAREAINLDLSVGPLKSSIILNEFKSTENTNRFDPYTVEINDSILFRRPQKFEYCDTIPGPGLNEETLTVEQAENQSIFEEAIRDIPPGLYTRRELFARKMWDSVKRKVDFIYDDEQFVDPTAVNQRAILNNYLNNFLRNHVYNTESRDFSEGIFEQIFFSLRDSRIYDQENYYEELKRRVNGEVYISEDGCYKNRYNVSQFGILSFEKMVTDELADQINLELAKPENDPYNLDFDDPSPIEKAIQNVCLIGFIRVCIVELMLKGSLAYSVWDVEGVSDEPFMKDFVVRFVEQELRRHPSMSNRWEEVISRVTGIEQTNFALRDLTQKQLIRVQGVSKKIFQNDSNLDYYNWFVKYFVPQTEVSRVIAREDDAEPRANEFEGQVISGVGSVTGTENIQIEGVQDKIYWQHPLMNPEGIMTLEDPFSNLRNPIDLASNLLGGNNPFFHIEHCIEVQGPLAQLETLILPGADIVREMISANEGNIADPRLTHVPNRNNRDFFRLNIENAYGRLNLPELKIQEYSLRSTPELPEAAKGSAAEKEADLNRLHEVYHIDDFVEGLSSVFNADDIEKYFMHLRGLMHYDENPATAPGGIPRNTSVPAANGNPEAIRRTPTRFITKKRKIISFAHDFVSHNSDSFFPPAAGERPNMSNYKRALRENPRKFLNEPETAAEAYNQFVSELSTDNREDRYYILPSDGEQIINLISRGVPIEEFQNDERFLSRIAMDNGLDVPAEPVLNGAYIDHSFERINDDIPMAIKAEVIPGASRSLEKNIDLEVPVPEGGFDLLTHRFNGNADATTVIFENTIGRIETEEDFNIAKNLVDNSHEETWVETVFEFKDAASIIVGLHGSFSIGETFDPAVLSFEPNLETKRIFETRLAETIDSLYGQDSYNNAKIENASDPKLTQYGRTLFIRDTDGNPDIFLARPLGIDRYANADVTKYWTTTYAEGGYPSFYVGEAMQAIANADAAATLRRESRKLIVRPAATEMLDRHISPPSREDLIPENFYKIPMRVLVTQVYLGEDVNPSEVYCKVVLPEYIRDMHLGGRRNDNIEKLNFALTQMANEYVDYVEQVRDSMVIANGQVPDIDTIRDDEAQESFPDFTTDFTRAHADDWNTHTRLEHPQYCSIEGLYSRVFANESRPLRADRGPNYNSDLELDDLFQNRGQLMVHRSPPPVNSTPGAVAPLNGDSETSIAVDRLHFMESCTYFHLLPRSADPSANYESFHKTVFSLHNIFQWYLRNRRANTLWGALTATQGASRGSPAVDGVPTTTQEIPLAQSYSSEFLIVGDGLNALNDNQAATGRAHWSVAILPGKSWSHWLNHDPGDNESSGWWGFASDRIHIPTGRYQTSVQETPGFFTLYPGADDVNNISTEGFASGRRAPGQVRINKSDYTNWNFFGNDNPGLMSDGIGRNLVNYNRFEHTPMRNTGQSLFHSDGIISQLDISMFIRTSVKKLLLESYPDPELLVEPPETLFNLEDFYTVSNGQNQVALTDIITDGNQQQFFIGGFEVFNDLGPHFDPALLTLDSASVDGLLTSLEHITRRLSDLASSQVNFCIQTEASLYNAEIRQSAYKLAILNRFVAKIRAMDFKPKIKLLLLTVASIYNLPNSLSAILKRAPDAVAVGNPNVEDISDEDLVDWAAACVHFLGSRLIGGTLHLEGSALDTNLANVFTHGSPRVYIAHNTHAHRDANAAAIRRIGGNIDAIGTAASWQNTRSQVLDVGRHGMTPRQIIQLTNQFYFIIFQDGRHGYPPGTEGPSFSNNSHILRALKDPNLHTQYMVDEFGTRYQNALARLNIQSAAATRSLALDNFRDPEHIQRLLLSTDSLEWRIISEGKVEDFFLKLDYRLFFQLFGQDGSPNAFDDRTATLRNWFAASAGRQKGHNESLLNYYKETRPRIYYSSVAGQPRRRDLIEQLTTSHPTAVVRLAERWKTAYGNYTGLTAQLLGSEMLRSAVINGQVVRGLLENSVINQIARLVSNTFISKPSGWAQPGSAANSRFKAFVQSENGIIQEVSEEFRSFLMKGQSQDIFSVPMAEYKKSISSFKEVIDECYDPMTLKEDYKRLQPWMADQLIESEDAKQIFQYIFPVKRYQAVSTAFVTSALAGYSTMPSVMQTPKASLAALMGTTAMTRRERTQVFDNFSQGEFFKQIMDNATSDPKGLDCFGFPFPGDFLSQFGDLLEELFLQFPSIFFRGIASAVDPAYKEMKKHWENCDINKLTWSGTQWAPTINEKEMTAGLMGKPNGGKDSNYAMILPSSPIDIAAGVAKIASNPFSSSNWKKFGRALERTTGYIYKGPLALVDGAFSLKIPCLDVDTGEWPNTGPWNTDRYGHPLSPLTAIALTMPELKGEKRRRQLKGCGDEPYSEEQIEDNACPDEDTEPKPFGDMPTAEEE
jgi:hypothetical protein